MVTVYMLIYIINLMSLFFSQFDGNFGGDGATVSISFNSGSFDNVTFTNHRGPVVRVRI